MAEAFNGMLESLERRDAELASSQAEREERLQESFAAQQRSRKSCAGGPRR